MAAKGRLVNTNFWRDTYVINLDPTEKLLFLYFITNPSTSLAGVYEIDIRLAALDTGIDKDMVMKILNRFCKDEKMYYERGWLVLRNFLKHQRINPSMKIGIEKAISELPDWLQEKLHKMEDLQHQITLELTDSPQSVDSLVPQPPQMNLKESNLNKRNRKESKAASRPAEADKFKYSDKELYNKESKAMSRKLSAQEKQKNAKALKQELLEKGLI